MTRKRRYESDLLPAVISELVLRLIDQAIAPGLRGNVTWDVGSGKETIESHDVENFLTEVANESRFDELNLEVWDEANDTGFYPYCESVGSSLSYHCDADQQSQLAIFANSVEGLFRNNKRWCG